MKKRPGISKNKPFNLVALILVTLAVLGLQLIFPDMELLHQVDSCRSINIWMNNVPVSQFWSSLGALPFVLLNLFLVYHINSRFNIIRDAYYFPSWMYLVFSLSDYRMFHLSEDLIASSFFLLAMYLFFLIPHCRKEYTRIFWSGFFLAAGSLFLPQTLLYIPLFITGLFIFNRFRLRNIMNFILAIFTVYFLLFSTSYLLDNLPAWHEYFVFNHVFEGIVVPEFIPLMLDSLLVFMVLVSLVFFFMNAGFLKVLTRKYLVFMVLFVFVSSLAYILDGFDVYIRFFLAVPMTFIITNYLLNTKTRFLPLTLTWIIFIFFILSQSLSVFSSLS